VVWKGWWHILNPLGGAWALFTFEWLMVGWRGNAASPRVLIQSRLEQKKVGDCPSLSLVQSTRRSLVRVRAATCH
jgi:hypothetical protein